MYKLATTIGRILGSHGGLPPGVADDTQFRGFWNISDFRQIENPAQGHFKFWRQTPPGWGNTGAIIELKNPRPDPNHEPRIEFGPLVKIGASHPEVASKDEVTNDSNDEITVTKSSERKKTYRTSDNVGASLTFGFKQRIGGEASFAAAEFEQSVTASYEKQMESTLEGTNTVSVDVKVPPKKKKEVSYLLEETDFEQTNKVSGILDCEIHIHTYTFYTWRFATIERFVETWAGRGQDWWAGWEEKRLAGQCRSNPLQPRLLDMLKDRPKISYEKKVQINASTQGNIRVGEAMPL